MRSEHHHPSDEAAYIAFLNSAVKVRKFTKKAAPVDQSNAEAKQRRALPTTSKVDSKAKRASKLDAFHNTEDLAAASVNRNSKEGEDVSQEIKNPIQPLLVEIKQEKKDWSRVKVKNFNRKLFAVNFHVNRSCEIYENYFRCLKPNKCQVNSHDNENYFAKMINKGKWNNWKLCSAWKHLELS